ncbi:MAG: DUF58 domain-containing protein [Lachnospiraceae bacterium]|nr:DUF58 domain-containing protein [Lachnospiraceae bacterium]
MKRNRIIYFMLCVGAVVLASFYGGPVSYSILFGLVFVALISYAYLLVVYLFFKLYQVVQSKHITACEPIPYYFVLQNEYLLNFCRIKTKMYSTFSYVEKMPEDHEYELLPNESARYDTKLICRYRGEYKVGIKEITITDFLRLFSVTYRVPEPIGVVVSARIIPLNSLRIENDPARNSYRENMRLSTDYDAAVRDYVPGDPLKGVHQKLSAKTGKLKSRLTYGEEKQGISIFIDTGRISTDEYVFIPVENKALEIALALVNYYSGFSIPCSLEFYRVGRNVLKCSGLHEMETFAAEVSSIQFRTDDDAGEAARLMLSEPSFRNCMVAFMIVMNTGKELNEALNELSMAGVTSVVYCVGYDSDTSDILDLPNQMVIPVHPVDDLPKVM